MEQTASRQLELAQTAASALSESTPPENIPAANVQSPPTIGLGNDRLYTPVQFFGNIVPQMLYPDLSRAAGGSRSRTELRSATGLEQHQRVHDADESGFVHDPIDRTDSYFDPRQAVIFQTGIHERTRGRQKRRPDWSRNKRAGQAGLLTPGGDVFDTVIRVVQALNFVEHHRHTPAVSAAAGAPSRELALVLRGLIRTAATPVRNRIALSGSGQKQLALPGRVARKYADNRPRAQP